VGNNFKTKSITNPRNCKSENHSFFLFGWWASLVVVCAGFGAADLPDFGSWWSQVVAFGWGGRSKDEGAVRAEGAA
jgi:hypothetical protein